MPKSKVQQASKVSGVVRSQAKAKRRLGGLAHTGEVLGDLAKPPGWKLSPSNGRGEDMREIAISKFKATCLAELENVRRTRKPLRITRFGKPIAEIVPPAAPSRKSWIGCMEGTAEIVGDIVGPVGAFDGWDPD